MARIVPHVKQATNSEDSTMTVYEAMLLLNRDMFIARMRHGKLKKRERGLIWLAGKKPKTR